jgi:formylglycine-generating enzyme required for sulfatase activity
MKPLALGLIATATMVLPAQALSDSDQADRYTEGKNYSLVLQNVDVNANDVPMELVWIPRGTFTMGSPESESGSEKWEHPRTTVVISKGFWLGKTVVTQAQYKAVMGINPSHFDHAGPDAPVEQVRWYDAMEFCQRVTFQESANGRLLRGYAYTLPTEAQWEYACRAGTTGPLYAEDLSSIAWYGKNSQWAMHQVGQKKPNAFGLYDMLGNVWQWCSDRFGPYPGGRQTDPTGPDAGFYRVERGGSWWNGPADCRCATRFWDAPGYRYNELLGFRVALSQTP